MCIQLNNNSIYSNVPFMNLTIYTLIWKQSFVPLLSHIKWKFRFCLLFRIVLLMQRVYRPWTGKKTTIWLAGRKQTAKPCWSLKENLTPAILKIGRLKYKNQPLNILYSSYFVYVGFAVWKDGNFSAFSLPLNALLFFTFLSARYHKSRFCLSHRRPKVWE